MAASQFLTALPLGGSDGQVLTKCSALNFDCRWMDSGGGSLSACWPVGSVFTSVVSTNPNTLLGFGTWAALAAGRVLVGLDAGDPDFDTVRETGGAKTVTLTEAQIPSHTHVQDAHTHTQNAHTHVQDAHTHVQDAHTHTQDAHTHTQNSFAPRIINSGTAGTVGVQGASAASNANASNAATTATNQNATATNQNTTATNQNATAVNQNATATNQSTIAVNQNTGGDGAHANVQPYFVVYFWERTA